MHGGLRGRSGELDELLEHEQPDASADKRAN
jgi:hypothetical protein